MSQINNMKLLTKSKILYRISFNESGVGFNVAARTELNPKSFENFQNMIKRFRRSANWVKIDAKESAEMVKQMVNNPKEAVNEFGRDVAKLWEMAALKFNPPKNGDLNPKEADPIINQKYPNPLKVYPNGKTPGLGQRTHLMAVEQVKNNRFIKGEDGQFYYEGRRIIGQNTPNLPEGVNGGVYTGSSVDNNNNFVREAIVVDFNNDPIVSSFYQKLIDKIVISKDKGIENIVSIYDELITPMICLENSENLAKKYKGKKVQLGVFMNKNGVVCRHNAVLFSLMFQKLKEQGLIPVDYSCTINRHYGTWKGGQNGMHVYCKVNTSKEYFIIDPVQKSSGWLKDVASNNPYAAEGDLFNPFEYGQKVKVLRTDLCVENWQVSSIIRDPENHINDLVVVNSEANNPLIQKTVPMKTLLDWQQLNLTPNQNS